MSNYEWRDCKYCKKPSYKSPEAHRDHEEECGYIMLRAGIRPCPKCGSHLSKILPGSWICSSESCDYEVKVLP